MAEFDICCPHCLNPDPLELEGHKDEFNGWLYIEFECLSCGCMWEEHRKLGVVEHD